MTGALVQFISIVQLHKHGMFNQLDNEKGLSFEHCSASHYSHALNQAATMAKNMLIEQASHVN